MAFEYRFIRGLDDNLKYSLERDYGIDELDIDDIFTSTQLSKVEQRQDYLYVAIQLPEYEKSRKHFLAKEVHCLISSKFFLVIDKHQFSHVLQFNNIKDGIIEEDEDPIFAFYEMLDFVITKIYKVLNKFRAEVADLEDHLFDENGGSIKEDFINQIQVVKRNLVNFISIMFPLQTLLNELQTRYIKFIDKEGVELLDDSLDKVKKMLNVLNNFRQQMEVISETNEALIARNTNNTIKVLTSVSLIAIIPTAITSFFGMNVYFGFIEKSYWPLVCVIVLTLSSTTTMMYYFKKKNWL